MQITFSLVSSAKLTDCTAFVLFLELSSNFQSAWLVANTPMHHQYSVDSAALHSRLLWNLWCHAGKHQQQHDLLPTWRYPPCISCQLVTMSGKLLQLFLWLLLNYLELIVNSLGWVLWPKLGIELPPY